MFKLLRSLFKLINEDIQATKEYASATFLALLFMLDICSFTLKTLLFLNRKS
jgi:hypothetical protein